MVSIAGSKKLKRQMSPLFWGIGRKSKRFAITVRPGSHPKNSSFPTAILLRDVLNVVTTLREAKSVIYGGKINVDGVIRKSLHHSVGLMDVVELQGVSDVYRLVPTPGHTLQPIKIETDEKSKKIVKVTSKTTIKGKKIQLGFHDGRTIIAENNVNVGDSCLIQIPGQEILDVIKLEKDSLVLVTRGVNTGKIGRINNITEATFTLSKRINLTIDKKKFEMPADLVIVIGKEKPVVKIQ